MEKSILLKLNNVLNTLSLTKNQKQNIVDVFESIKSNENNINNNIIIDISKLEKDKIISINEEDFVVDVKEYKDNSIVISDCNIYDKVIKNLNKNVTIKLEDKNVHIIWTALDIHILKETDFNVVNFMFNITNPILLSIINKYE